MPSPKRKRTHYTVKEVEQFRERLFRQHQREQMASNHEYYKRGVAHGSRACKDAMRVVLGLPPLENE